MNRKFLIAGNWKMNRTSQEAVSFMKSLLVDLPNQVSSDIAICPPFTALASMTKYFEREELFLGAQNMHESISGAFTGEVSVEMLKDLLVSYVILGHSERRSIFNETDVLINAKIKSALAHRIRPIVCIGETLEEREANQTNKVLEKQLEGAFKDITITTGEDVVVAYEPVWAIGTGKSATPEMAQETHSFIRQWLSTYFGKNFANKIRILYGGSLKPENADALLTQPDIDGGLIGGASLEVNSFLKIINTAQELSLIPS